MEKEQILTAKKKGIFRRMLDTNVALMAAGYNKLREGAKLRKAILKNKMKKFLKTLQNQDSQLVFAAYNSLKENYLKINCVGFENGMATKLKQKLIRKIADKSHNLQTQAIYALKQYLLHERDLEHERLLEAERLAKEKERY